MNHSIRNILVYLDERVHPTIRSKLRTVYVHVIPYKQCVVLFPNTVYLQSYGSNLTNTKHYDRKCKERTVHLEHVQFQKQEIKGYTAIDEFISEDASYLIE